MEADGNATLLGNASFIFSGHVNDIEDPPSKQEDEPPVATVEVERVYLAPDSLAGYAGQTVLVGFDEASRLEPGDTRLFFTNPVEFAEKLSVYSIADMPSGEDEEERLDLLREEEERHQLAARISGSSLIVHGVVIALRQAASDESPSEHDPDWWIARIAIRELLRGHPEAEPGNSIDVAFANSRDVAWVEAPKLAPSQQAIFFVRENVFPETEARLAVYEPSDVVEVTAESLEAIRERMQ
jgi:hypothetical protein